MRTHNYTFSHSLRIFNGLTCLQAPMPEAKKISEVLRISLEEAEALKDDRPGPVSYCDVLIMRKALAKLLGTMQNTGSIAK